MSDETHLIASAFNYDQRGNNTPQCQHGGCDASAIACEIPGGIDFETKEEYDESYEYYCSEHAPEHGFCCCCGSFIAGINDFSVLCEHCEDQID